MFQVNTVVAVASRLFAILIKMILDVFFAQLLTSNVISRDPVFASLGTFRKSKR